MPEDKILDKIRGLLAKAAATDFQEEAEAFAAKATELMARYGVEQSMLAARNPASDPVESRTIRLEDPYARTRAVLLDVVADAFNSKSVYLAARGNGGLGAFSIVYGHRSDLDRVEFLYTLLLQQAVRMVLREHAPHTLGVASRVAAYRRSWLLGFTARIQEHLQAGRAQATAEAGTGAELVLVDRKAKAQQARDAAHPELRTAKTTVGRSDGFCAGARAASSADLSQDHRSTQSCPCTTSTTSPRPSPASSAPNGGPTAAAARSAAWAPTAL